MTPESPAETLAYRALALQVACRAINRCPDRASARARMAETVERIARRCQIELVCVNTYLVGA
jgi:hypothetical protein